MKTIETREIERDYGFMGTDAIIDHPKHGRMLLCDGYGGETSLAGGAVRWRHGIAVKLQPTDTFESLSTAWNDYTTVFSAVVTGHDPDRPIFKWSGSAVSTMARSAGLE